ncbi:MAG: hypothetical protein RLN69_05200 [Woeseiaceae bacterium]
MKSILAGLLLVVAGAVLAQESVDPTAVEASKLPDAADEAAAEALERDELEPGVPSAVLAEDIRRSSSDGRVMDEIDLGRTEITGNQELPKVLYIVPWQKSDPGDLTGKPVITVLDEVMAPLDRTEFIRQVEYYDDLYGETKE